MPATAASVAARHQPLPNGDYVRRDGTHVKRLTLHFPPSAILTLKAQAAAAGITLSDLILARLGLAAGDDEAQR